MFEANEERRSNVEKALALFREYGRGETVPHGRIEKATGLERGDAAYYAVVDKARRQFEDEDCICTVSEASVGWRLLTEQETIVEYQHMRAKRARRHISKGFDAAVKLPDESLTDRQRRLRDAAIENAETLRRQLSSRALKAKQAMEPHRGLPLRSA